jgi:hypothetical protein
VLVLLLAVAIAGVVIGLVSLAVGRHRRFDDVERFHRARQMTTEWSRAAVSRPLIAAQPSPDEMREPAER